jgi:hypothetical protein
MAAAAATKDNKHQKKRDLLGRQQCRIDDAVLAGSVADPGISQLRLDNGALCKDVSSHVVQIGLVILYPLNLDYLGLARLGISYSNHIAAEHAHLLIAA